MLVLGCTIERTKEGEMQGFHNPARRISQSGQVYGRDAFKMDGDSDLNIKPDKSIRFLYGTYVVSFVQIVVF